MPQRQKNLHFERLATSLCPLIPLASCIWKWPCSNAWPRSHLYLISQWGIAVHLPYSTATLRMKSLDQVPLYQLSSECIQKDDINVWRAPASSTWCAVILRLYSGLKPLTFTGYTGIVTQSSGVCMNRLIGLQVPIMPTRRDPPSLSAIMFVFELPSEEWESGR